MGKYDENEASKLLCGCNYQGGRRDRPASLRLMHQRQPIIIDFSPVFLFFFKKKEKKDGPRDFLTHRRTVFSSQLMANYAYF